MQYLLFFKIFPLKRGFSPTFTWGIVNRDYTTLPKDIPKTKVTKGDMSRCKT